MGLCKDLFDRLPDSNFMVDIVILHGKYPLTPIERERLDFAVIDTQDIQVL